MHADYRTRTRTWTATRQTRCGLIDAALRCNRACKSSGSVPRAASASAFASSSRCSASAVLPTRPSSSASAARASTRNTEIADFRASSKAAVHFVGLKNYTDVLADPVIWRSFATTLWYVIVSVTGQFVVGFGLALLLNRPIPGKGLITTLLLLPMMLSPVVVGLFWKLIYDPSWGILNYALGLGVVKALSQGMEGKFRDRLTHAQALNGSYEWGGIETAWGRFFDKLPWPKRDRKKAEEHLRKAIELNPSALRARVYLASTYLDADRTIEAKHLLDEVAASPVGRYDAPEERRAQALAAGLMPTVLAKLK